MEIVWIISGIAIALLLIELLAPTGGTLAVLGALGLAAAGYDAAQILINAMERASAITPQAIRDELAKTKDFEGATGKITINGDRNADKDAFIVKVEGKALKFVTLLSPGK